MRKKIKKALSEKSIRTCQRIAEQFRLERTLKTKNHLASLPGEMGVDEDLTKIKYPQFTLN